MDIVALPIAALFSIFSYYLCKKDSGRWKVYDELEKSQRFLWMIDSQKFQMSKEPEQRKMIADFDKNI